MFERIVVGVDGSPAGFEALHQARSLLASGGRLLAVIAFVPEIAVHAGIDAARIAAGLTAEAHAARDEAERLLEAVPGAEARLVHGDAIDALLAAVRVEGASLVAVGSHGGSRAAGIAFGSVATAMLHDAPCSVLVARTASAPAAFPHAIVVGDDGSLVAGAAVRIAEQLGEHLGASVRTIIALGGKQLTLSHVPIRPGLDRDERPPVEALCAGSAGADLLVVGSRGLHGVAALGSVSERVAHRAACSVLVVRPEVDAGKGGPAAASETAA